MANEWLFPDPGGQNEDSNDNPRNEELFVFGYHCKLFRDDEQAKLVDSGAYMIPWMGDESLKIDRYDGRGHLYDLRPHDADNLKGKPAPIPSEDEQHVEKLCDEERYLELHTDLAEKTMYEEEEWKRYYESLSEGYKAVGFSYDTFGQAYAEPVPEEPKLNPEEAAFVPAKELQVPAGVDIPSTIKENAVIEKTAKFVAEHGIQMEIVLKTKQANNPQFMFMHFEDVLHPYYKHLVKMIKAKKYIPKSPVKEEHPDALNESGEGDDGGHGYLHPTLLTTNRASPVPQEPYKPIQMPKVSIHETSYGQLLQSFSKVNKEVEEKKREREVKMKKEIKSEPQESSSLPACVAQPAYGTSMPPPPGIEPVQLPKSSDTTQVKQEPQEHSDGDVQRTNSPPAQIVPPPPDAQPIIDRMAMYVAKNGEEFEIVVKTKKDTRFQFLESWHTHYPYYNFKRHLFQEEIEREKKEKEAEEKKKEQEKAEILAKGVKFKLKKASKEQDSTTLEKKPVFEYDESDDENEDSDSTRDSKRAKSNSASGTSTPVRDSESTSDTRTSEQLERKLAEQRLKDRLAASAREKLSQVDKDKQIKAERKKKAALFINLLKSKNVTDQEEAPAQATTGNSERNSPAKQEEEHSSRHKSKHKSRDRKSRSRSRDRSSRSRRSRSRSKSKKKRRKRSPTPPSAYNVSRRSPLRFPHPPPPPPRHMDVRGRYSRSPSKGGSSKRRSRSRSKDRSSRQKSRSRSPSRSKSKKKKRSRSPKSRKEHSSHKKSSKKKKKRSRSRSKEKKVSGPAEMPAQDEAQFTAEVIVLDQEDPRIASPAGLEEDTMDTLEEGETRDSTPEPGQISDTDTACKDSSPRSARGPPDIESEENQGSPEQSPRKRKRSRSVSRSSSRSTTPHSKVRSRSFSPETRRSRVSRSRSQTPTESKSSSRSGSPHVRNQIATASNSSVSREVTPVKGDTTTLPMEVASPASTGEVNGTEEEQAQPQGNVSSYMLNRVRAIIKASREAVKQEDSMFEEDT